MQKSIQSYKRKTATLNSSERRTRAKNSLVFCPKTGCYVTHDEYRDYLESLVAY